MKEPWFFIVCELGEDAKPQPTIRDIQRAVCSRYKGVSLHDLRGPWRNKSVVRARHIAMYLARHMTLQSYPTIAKQFGGRDHSSILDAVRKIEMMERDDRKTAAVIRSVRQQFGSAA